MRWLIASAVILGVLFWFAYFQVDRGVMVPGQTVLESALQWVVHAVGNAIAVTDGSAARNLDLSCGAGIRIEVGGVC